jgi:AcrR family transcriptional regulator
VKEVGPQPGPLLEVLHAVQHRLGCVPEEAVAPIAEALNLSRAEVHGTITFYHHFRRKLKLIQQLFQELIHHLQYRLQSYHLDIVLVERWQMKRGK